MEYSRRYIFEKKLPELSISMRIFSVFNLTNLTLKQLKKKYKRLALKFHPDRGGSEEKFQVITQCYLKLYEMLIQKFTSPHNDMKTSFRKFEPSSSEIKLKNDFNIDQFNQAYEKNRIATPYDRGYGTWKMEQLPQNEHGEYKYKQVSQTGNKIFSKKFNVNVFNTFFEKERSKHSSTDLTPFSIPEATNSFISSNHVILGQNSFNTFATHQYQDYKTGLGSGFLVTNNKVPNKYASINSLEDLKEQRKRDLSKDFSKELQQIKLHQKEKQLEEQARMLRYRNYSNFIQ